MPGFWTHIIYGKDVLQSVGLDLEAANREQFNLGCLFTDAGQRCSREDSEYALWSLSHTFKCDVFANEVCARAREISRFYALGVFCHYFLDATVNQYILSRAGSGYRREQLEIMIDKTILKERELDILKLNPKAELPEYPIDELDELYRDVAFEIYGIEDYSLIKALKSMKLDFDNFYGRSNVSLLFKRIWLREDSREEAYFKSTHEDPLNLNMKPWFHNITGWQSKQSFKKLYGEALDRAHDFLQGYLDGKEEARLPSVSLMTNLPLVGYS